MTQERLQKILARAGVASRRTAERLIEEGRVRVNGRIVRELGTRADPLRDRVEVDGKRLVAEKPVYYLLHKPRGVVTTLDDPEGRESIKDLTRDIPERVFPVGRLDFQTSGVLLLTNDGIMTQALLHPARRVPKIYSVKLQGHVDERGLTMLREGVVLDDGDKTAPAEVAILRRDDKHTFLLITISEGKNRQIHRMAEAIGRRVLRLARISFAGLVIEGLRAGQMRALTASELSDLKQKYLNPQKRQRVREGGRFEEAEGQQPRSFAEARRRPKAPPVDGRGVRTASPEHARGVRSDAKARGVRSDAKARGVRSDAKARGVRSDAKARGTKRRAGPSGRTR